MFTKTYNSKKSFSLISLSIVAFIFMVIQSTAQTASAAPAQSSGENGPRMLVTVSTQPIYQVEVIQNIVYGQGLRRSSWDDPGGEPMNLILHAFLPDTPTNQLRPAIMLFHGGGFKGGDAGYPRMREIANFYAARGWAVFSVNYRLRDHFGSRPENFPAEPFRYAYPAARDAKAAVRWLHANAGQYRVSRDHITVYGGSAGGMLAVMLGMSDAADYRDEISLADDPTLITTNLEAPAHVQTVVSFWGGEPLLKALELYDGRSRYDNQDPPTLLVHGTEDNKVPFYLSERVYLALNSVNVPVEFHILQGRGHSAWNARLGDGRTIYEAAFDFIVQQQQLPTE